MVKSRTANGANLGFEDKLWAAADKLRGNMDAAEYKHVVLGLIFLKYISDAFMEKFTALQQDKYADPEDRDEVVFNEALVIADGYAARAGTLTSGRRSLSSL